MTTMVRSRLLNAALHMMVLLAVLMLTAVVAFCQDEGDWHWRSFNSGQPGVILEGNWQSCQEDNDTWTERAYEIHRPGKSRVLYSFHMGPRDEFALFRGPDPIEHRDHAGRENLLGPAYHHSDVQTYGDKRNWSLDDLWLNIIRAGGSREDCYSFWVLLEQKPRPGVLAHTPLTPR